MNKQGNDCAAVIYARYSPGSRQNEQSIEGQLHENHAYAERMGLTVIGEYIDRALTGRNDDRADFQRMISDAAKKQFKYIIVYKLDRFARNRYDSAIYKHQLKKYGVRVLSACETLSDSPEGIILEAMLEASAEYYSANLSQNVKRGLKESALKANSCGGTIPLGYALENKKLVIREDEAEIVRFIFDNYAKGVGKAEIADALNKRGLRTRRGCKFSVNSFSELLSNKKYIGTFTYNNIDVPGGCPAIIDDVTFEKCAKKIAAARRAPAAAKAKVEYILRGKLFCGYCGAPMVGESGHGSKIYHYYTCRSRKKSHACAKKNERQDFIEWYICEQTVNYALNPENADYIAESVVAAFNAEFDGRKSAEKERQIAKITREISSLVDSLVKTTASAALDVINQKIENLDAQRSELRAEIASLKLAANIKITPQEVKAWLKSFGGGDLFDVDFRRRIVDALVNAVYLYDDRLLIYWNARDAEQVSFIDAVDDFPADYNNSDLKCDGSPNRKVRFYRAFLFLFASLIIICVF